MADVSDNILSQIGEIVQNTNRTTEEFEKVTSALTEKIDKISTSGPSDRTIRNLDTKIGDLNTKTSATDGLLTKMDNKLGDMSKLMEGTNKLTQTQNKLLQTLDPGSRRLKGDTYDSPVTRDRKFDRQREKLIRRMGGSVFVRNPIKTALGASMLLGPLRALWNHKMIVGALAAGGLMDPNYWGSNMGFREGALGDNSWLRRNLGGKGGITGAALDWSLNNPGYAAGGALALGTGLGRAGIGLGLEGARRAYGMGGGLRLASTRTGGLGWRNPNVAAGTWRHGQTAVWGSQAVHRAHGLPATAATTVGEKGALRSAAHAAKIKVMMSGVIGRKAKAAAMAAGSDAIRRGATVAIAKQLAHLVAARTVQGLAMAATGVGTAGTVLLWGATIYQVGGMIWPYVSKWIWPPEWAQQAKDLKKFKQLALNTEEQLEKHGMSIKDPETGKFRTAKEFDKLMAEKMGAAGFSIGTIKSPFGTSQYWRTKDEKGRWRSRAAMDRASSMSKTQRELYDKVRPSSPGKDEGVGLSYLKSIQEGGFGAGVNKRTTERKRIAEKIVAISDGRQFTPGGRRWSVENLWKNYSTTQLQDLYSRIVLPRASSNPKINDKAKAAVKARTAMKPGATGHLPSWATAKGEEGMAVEGSAAHWTQEDLWRRVAENDELNPADTEKFVKEQLAETARIKKEEEAPGKADALFNQAFGFPQMQLALQEQAKADAAVARTVRLHRDDMNYIRNQEASTDPSRSPHEGLTEKERLIEAQSRGL